MNERLIGLRKEIDAIDETIVGLFAARFRVTRTVGMLKKEQSMPPVDPEREEQKMRAIAELAISKGLDPDFMKNIMRMTIDESVANHLKIRDGEGNGYDYAPWA